MKKEVDWEKYRKFVLYEGRRRRANFKNFRIDDFIAGAACVYFFLKAGDQLPAEWVFGLMAGKDILAEREEQEPVKP